METANAIINNAIEALQQEAQAVQAKITALQNSLSLAGRAELAPSKPRRGRSKKSQMTKVEAAVKAPKSPPKAKTRAKAKDKPAPKDKLQTAAEKRSKSWDTAKKAAAAERMRKYWADRKKKG